MYKAIVTTNCEDDEFLRVKVKCPQLWPEESELLPSLNGIYLEEGDAVILSMTSLRDVIIIGKFVDYDQIKANPKGYDPVLFQLRKDSDWIVGTMRSKQLKIQSSEGLTAEDFYDKVVVTTPDKTITSIKDNEITIKTSSGAEVTVKGSKVSVKNQSLSLRTILDELITQLSTQVPTTMGSPAAQNFNPVIVTALTKAKTELNQLME